jgi:NAD(P)-dependent dehydrogenase (short-subunit alcohol dehydrogenase family)
MSGALFGKTAIVAGATRGAGRGIARMLGEAGATVYCVGRSTRRIPRIRPVGAGAFALSGRPEVVEETAELVTAAGGCGIAVIADLGDETAARELAARVVTEQGRIDLLVNDIWGGDEYTVWGQPFWQADMARLWAIQEQAVLTHLHAARWIVPQMVAQRSGLIIEVTDGDGTHYRGNLGYDLAKQAVIRLAYGMQQELAEHAVTALAVTPGYLRSEAMLEHFGVSEENWREAIGRDAHFAASETPCFVGRAIAALASDPQVSRYGGQVLTSWDLSEQYGFSDIDGRRPHWGNYSKTLS